MKRNEVTAGKKLDSRESGILCSGWKETKKRDLKIGNPETSGLIENSLMHKSKAGYGEGAMVVDAS